MHIIVDRATFTSRLAQLDSVIEKKQTLPILANFKITADDTGLTLTANNLEQGVKLLCPAHVRQPGEQTMPTHKLFEIFKELTDGDVTLTTDDDCWVTITQGRSKQKIAGLPVTDFPDLPMQPGEQTVTLPQTTLADMLATVNGCTSQDEARYVLTGVLCACAPDTFRLIATDGHRLATHHIAAPCAVTRDVIVPGKAVTLLKRFCRSSDPVTLTTTANQLRAEFPDGTCFATRLVEGDYPNYRAIIRDHHAATLTLDRAAFIETVRRVSLLSADTHLLVCTASPGVLHCRAVSPQVGEAEDAVAADYTGETIIFGINAQYVFAALTAMSAPRVLVQLATPQDPIHLVPADETASLFLIMPMRV